MKMKKIAIALLATGLLPALASCGGKEEITMYVGAESIDFYQAAAKEFLQANPDFAYDIRVIAADTGTMGGAMLADNTACADIVTIAHDNIGKLAAKNLIRPITDEGLLAQINADNPAVFKSVIKSTIKIEGQDYTYTYGVPYIMQSLFLMYNKDYVTDEQAKTFEGLQAAALARRTAEPDKQNQIYGSTVTGADGFNFSFTILARKASDNSTTMKIYENLQKLECFAQGEDTVANVQWAQRALQDGTFIFPNDSGAFTMMNTHTVLSVIGGAWHYNAVVSALGDASKVGIAKVPTWTLTEADVAGTQLAAGTVMQGGSFVDCKCFCINAASAREKYESEQAIVKFLSTKDMQNRSFKEAMNVPAYEGFDTYVETIKDQISAQNYVMAKVHTEMQQCGIAQPFVTATLNNYYYQAGGPDLYKNAIKGEENKDHSITLPDNRGIREMLFRLEYTWKWGNGTLDKLVIPDVLPGDTNTKAQ